MYSVAETKEAPAVGPAEKVPVSYAQQRMWLLHQLEHNSTEYNMLWAQRIHGNLDLPALKKAVNTIVARHEPLRTCISEVNGQPLQLVDPVREIEIPVEDLTGFDSATQEKLIKATLRKEGNEPIDLQSGPMLRFRLLKLADNEYVWFRVIHHINYDGWSDGVFCRELSALYNAYSRGHANPLTLMPQRYVDFATAQRKSLMNTMNEGLAYWRKQLEGIPEQLQLPTDRPLGGEASLGSGLHHVNLSPEQIQGVKRLSQTNGATVFMTMLGAFAVLLFRYTGCEDIVVGTPIANRRSAALEQMIGCFVNALALRLRFNPQTTFREFLKNVRDTAFDAYEHQDVPFERIVEELSPSRDAKRPPLFQVFFSMQDTPAFPLRLGDLNIEPPFRGERIRSRFDLELQVSNREGEPNLCWTYKKDLFDDWRIQQMARHYVALIDAIIADPNREIGDLDPLSIDEQAVLSEDFNITRHSLPKVTLPSLFEEQAQKHPDATAIIFDGMIQSFGDLNQRANRIAHCLIARGIGSDSVVAIAMDRSPEVIVAMLGAWKCGAAFLVLDPDYPATRMAFILSDAWPKCVLTTLSVQSKLATTVPQLVVDAPEGREQLAHASASNPVDADRMRPSFEENAAYLIYTSGTTGKPKGVIGLHSGLINRLLWMGSTYPFDLTECVLARTSLGFIDGLTELFAPLVHGAPVVFANSKASRSPSDLIDLVRRWQISRMTVVPSLMNALLDEPNAVELRSCKLWISSGEPLLPSQAKRLWERFAESRLLNLYGCSEGSGDSLFAKCNGTDIVVGRPIWNTCAYILNEQLKTIPVGVTGELYTSGVGLARGYSGTVSQTARQFLPNPFGPPGGRIYRTGDLARRRRDGTVELLGRSDRQVKIRGQRIELAEIEAALRQQSSVHEAAVVGWNDGTGQTRLVAYVVPSAAHVLDTHDLRRQLMVVLPDYMIPSTFQTLSSLPKLSNGKLDTNQLPLPTQLPQTTSGSPKTAREETLCALFAEVLKLDHVGRDDDFFEIGGHSLLATQLINRIRQTFGVDLTLRAVLEAGTVANLGEKIL